MFHSRVMINWSLFEWCVRLQPVPYDELIKPALLIFYCSWTIYKWRAFSKFLSRLLSITFRITSVYLAASALPITYVIPLCFWMVFVRASNRPCLWLLFMFSGVIWKQSKTSSLWILSSLMPKSSKWRANKLGHASGEAISITSRWIVSGVRHLMPEISRCVSFLQKP